jgi:hypothetical protein
MAKKPIDPVTVILPGVRRRPDGTLEPHARERTMSRAEALRRLAGTGHERVLRSSPNAAVLTMIDPDSLGRFLDAGEMHKLINDLEEYHRQQGKGD